MTREKKELIQTFEKWFATNPNPSIAAAQCANIAENYAKSKIKKLTLTDAVSTFICDTCKNKGSIAYWHKTGMGIKPCKCKKRFNDF